MIKIFRYPLALIVIAQLFGTSLWFSPNSAASNLIKEWGISTAQFGYLTAATQIGFICGSLFLAVSGIADRYSASKLFAFACYLGALFNAYFAFFVTGLQQGLVVRLCVGICLAGVYPLGMKLIISWTKEGAGAGLGILVGMLTLGSALPYAVRAAGVELSWHNVVLVSSILACIGGGLLHSLGDGPYLPQSKGGAIKWGMALQAFKIKEFRATAFGYFGHMWELYAFWTIVPFFVNDLIKGLNFSAEKSIVLAALLSFGIIGIGSLGSILGGKLSKHVGSPIVAAVSLATSGLMCFLYPFAHHFGLVLSVPVLFLWGLTVVSDSAQFSATSAKVCKPDLVGGALTIQNSIGFFITVFSINLVTQALPYMGEKVSWYLLPGPLVGLLFFVPVMVRFRRGRVNR